MKAKKILAILIATIFFPSAIIAFGWIVQSDSPIRALSGRGTSSRPYLISSADDLVYFAGVVNSGETLGEFYFELTRDIDLGGMEWTPIGRVDDIDILLASLNSAIVTEVQAGKYFAGHFDGREYVISNFTITKSHYFLGFFGWSKGVVQNLTVSDVVVDVVVPSTAEQRIVFAASLIGLNEGLIKNCHAEGKVKTFVERRGEREGPNGSAQSMAGGLVGLNSNSGEVVDSSAAVDVSAICYDHAAAGGLIVGTYGAVSGSRASGNVHAETFEGSHFYSGAYAGGLIARVHATIRNSHAKGDSSVVAITHGGQDIVTLAGGFAAGMSVLGVVIDSSAQRGSIEASANEGTALAGGFLAALATSDINKSIINSKVIGGSAIAQSMSGEFASDLFIAFFL